MLDQSAPIHAWRLDLAAINAELGANGTPPPRHSVRRRRRTAKPLWEE